jgi:hypothetical protein
LDHPKGPTTTKVHVSKNVLLVMLYKEILVKSHLGEMEINYYNSNQTLVSLSLNDY